MRKGFYHLDVINLVNWDSEMILQEDLFLGNSS